LIRLESRFESESLTLVPNFGVFSTVATVKDVVTCAIYCMQRAAIVAGVLK